MKQIILIFFICSFIFAEDTLKTIHFKLGQTLNLRDPKEDKNKIDWHVGLSAFILFDSLMELESELTGSYERDNGNLYYSHSEKLGFKYGYISHIIDTEDSISLFNISAYYPFWKYFKAGADISWDYLDWSYGAYIGFKIKNWLSFEIIFWDDIQRIKGEFTPSIKFGKNKNIAMGIKAKILNIGMTDRLDWNAGYFIELSFNN
jgi:hypothetical protein